jgi:hypothetical protein
MFSCFHLMHVAVFLTLGQSWLASIWSLWRGRLETTTGGSLLPQATPLLPHVAKRWEALAVATLLLLLHPLTWVWRCGWCLLLWHVWATPPWPPWATTMNALMSEMWAHMNTASIFQLFSIITKCIRSFSDSKVTKQIGFRWDRTSIGEEGQSHWLDILMLEGRRRPGGRRRAKRRRRKRLGGRRWWWHRRLMRAEAPRMFRHGGSSPPRVVQGTLPPLASFEWLLVYNLL